LIRHLLLPERLAGTQELMEFLATEISLHTYLNIMDQYRPVYHASQFPEINRGISSQEFNAALEMAARVGLNRLDKRQMFRLF
jgi:putative pyruvate formate lyase activating enzyme